jgi:hypothetical protein
MLKITKKENCDSFSSSIHLSAYGILTVRSLLDLREHCMMEFEFVDVYSNEKREENRMGLEILAERCKHIDELADSNLKWYELFKG